MDVVEQAFPVEPADAGMRLDHFLALKVPTQSRMRLRQALDEGAVTVDGTAGAPGARLQTASVVRICIPAGEATGMTPEDIPLEVMHEDEALIVIIKPSGMVVHPAGRHRSGTLVNALCHRFNVLQASDPPIRPGLAHRLDRCTSGLMVVAKTQAALSALTVQFQERTVEKGYVALVHGSPRDDEGEWSAPIGNDPAAMPKWQVRADGRPAVSRYRVRRRFAGHALLELTPVTGRTNQLRLHCAHFGHPILGDELFGGDAGAGCARLFLHADRLGFTHPVSRERLRFATGFPGEFADELSRMARHEGGGDGPGWGE